MNEKERGT